MSTDVITVKPLRKMRLRVKFKDGAEGEVDLARWLPNVGIFRRRVDPAFFRQVRVNPDTGTIEWPNQADVDPVVLYHWTTGKPLPRWAGPLEDGCPSCTKRIARSSAARRNETSRRPRPSARVGVRRPRS